jgi:hypothetical protein
MPFLKFHLCRRTEGPAYSMTARRKNGAEGRMVAFVTVGVCSRFSSGFEEAATRDENSIPLPTLFAV